MCNVYNKGTYPEGQVLVYLFTMDTERKAQREFLYVAPVGREVDRQARRNQEPQANQS